MYKQTMKKPGRPSGPQKYNKGKSRASKYIIIRVTTFEKNRIKGLADLYANGNMSLWVLHQALSGERGTILTSDIKGSMRRETKKT